MSPSLKCLIVDDEPLAHEVILAFAADVPFVDIVGQCHLATEALRQLNEQPIDLLFLDIQMPKLKGLDFLRTLHKKPLVIITSAYEEYALEGYELEVCDYLLKPFGFDRFLKAVNKAYQLFQLQQAATVPAPQAATPTSTSNTQQLFIKSDKRLIQIDLADVYYLESYGNYVKVWLENEFHLTFRTLSSFASQLPEEAFFKTHKSFILHKKYIAYVEGNSVWMKNQKRIPLGKNNRQEFLRFLGGPTP